MGQNDIASWPDLLEPEMALLLGETLARIKLLIRVCPKLDDARHGADLREVVRAAACSLHARLVTCMAGHYRLYAGIFELATRDLGLAEARRRMEACMEVLVDESVLLILTAFALAHVNADRCREFLDGELDRVCAGEGMGAITRGLWRALAPTRNLNMPLRQYREKEQNELDWAAIFDGAHGPDAKSALRHELNDRYSWIKAIVGGKNATDEQREEARAPDALFRLIGDVPLAGLTALARSVQGAVRAAYAAEAPPEGLVKVNGSPLDRDVHINPQTGEVDDIDDYLPAGGKFAEDLNPERIYVTSEERRERFERLEAIFQSDLDSRNLSPKQRQVLREYIIEAPRRDDSPSSEGVSLRQFWGDDYDAKRKMLQRIRKHHPDFFAKWE